jgi:GH25 family lysozyme M1 (1,4-beta-N-acetylmuramidase)
MTLTDDQRLWAKETAYQRARKLGIPIPAGVHVFTRRNGHIVGIPFVGSPMRELIRRLQHRAGLPITGQFDTATLHWLGFSPPAPAHVYGVDVSNHQPSVDYAAVKRWTSEFLRTVKEQVGSCVLYTYPGFWGSLSNTAIFAHYPLWIANYGVHAPSLPNGWPSYAAWQFTSTGSVPGIPGHADRSVTGVALDSLRIQ